MSALPAIAHGPGAMARLKSTARSALAGLLLAAAPADFIPGLPDVPLMPGFAEREDARLVFDTPDGAILETHLVGTAPPDRVTGFYADSLPRLGWDPRGRQRFRRDDQCLELTVERRSGTTHLFVSVHPCPG